MIKFNHIYSIEEDEGWWESISRLNFTAVYTFKNKNDKHRRIEFKFLVI